MDDFLEFLNNRRTIRKYTSESVSDILVNQLLNASCRSATTGNMQVYSIVITKDDARKRILSPLHFNQKMITEAPLVLTFCADFNRFNKWCIFRNADPGYDNFLSFFTAAIDALLVAQTFTLAAESVGLGTCYIGTTTYNADKIIEALELPAGVVPVATITAGWPAETPEQVDRLPLEAVIHNEVYSNYSESKIDLFYRDKESRKDSKQFVKENSKETLAQVFTDVRYKKTDNEHFSNVLLQVMKKQGFIK